MPSRGDFHTASEDEAEFYSDFLTNFQVNPITGNLARAVNDAAIKQAIKNIVLTDLGERPFQPNLGSKIHSLLFDFPTSSLGVNLETVVKQCLESAEPRIKVTGVTGIEQTDSVEVNINYYVAGSSTPDSLTIPIKRVR